MRKMIKLLALAGMAAGLLAVAPSAQATGVPTECVVSGGVTLSPPVTNDGGGGAYSFTSVVLECIGGSHEGTYDVGSKGTRNADETCAQASGSGDLTGTRRDDGATITNGTLTYKRVAADVVVQGSFDLGGDSHSFVADLLFVPDPPQLCPTAEGVSSASLTGAATIL